MLSPGEAAPVSMQRRILLSSSLGALMAIMEMLQRYSQGMRKETYSIALAVCLSEALKTLLSGLVIRKSKEHSLFEVASDAGRLATPALIYFAQNTMGYLIFWSGLTAFEAAVLQQAKILMTAVLSYCILDRKLAMRKWRALFIMALGGVFIVRQSAPDGSSKPASINLVNSTRQPIVGVILVLFSCFTSGLAGVLMEKEYKRKFRGRNEQSFAAIREQGAEQDGGEEVRREDVEKDGGEEGGKIPTPPSRLLHVSVRNFQLGLCSLALSIVAVILFDRQRIVAGELFRGVSVTMCAISTIMAFTGLYVGLVIHELDVVWKNIGSIFQVVLSSCVSVLLYRDTLSFDFIAAAPIVMTAVFEYAVDGPVD